MREDGAASSPHVSLILEALEARSLTAPLRRSCLGWRFPMFERQSRIGQPWIHPPRATAQNPPLHGEPLIQSHSIANQLMKQQRSLDLARIRQHRVPKKQPVAWISASVAEQGGRGQQAPRRALQVGRVSGLAHGQDVCLAWGDPGTMAAVRLLIFLRQHDLIGYGDAGTFRMGPPTPKGQSMRHVGAADANAPRMRST